MSDLDLLLQWKAWETHNYEAAWLANVILWDVLVEEYIDAFLDSWHSAYGESGRIIKSNRGLRYVGDAGVDGIIARQLHEARQRLAPPE